MEYGDVAYFCEDGEHAISQLKQAANQIVQNGIGTSKKLDASIAQLKIEIDDLAKPNLEHTKAKINLWCEQHHWTHIDSQDTAQNNLQTQLAA